MDTPGKVNEWVGQWYKNFWGPKVLAIKDTQKATLSCGRLIFKPVWSWEGILKTMNVVGTYCNFIACCYSNHIMILDRNTDCEF